MWPDRVSNPGPLALESDALPTALRGPARVKREMRIRKMRSFVINYLCNDSRHMIRDICFVYTQYDLTACS